ncbi:MAG TPA: alkaline phosphatase family protein, partial [Rhizomicrobium sp.]
MKSKLRSFRAVLRCGVAGLVALPLITNQTLAAATFHGEKPVRTDVAPPANLYVPKVKVPQGQNDNNTTTPIKHVIVIVGENRSFDHLYGTYVSPSGDSVLNLLSEGIVNADGTPGPNFANAAQQQATDTTTYSVSPQTTGAYGTLPP